ncbi:sugar ABC transporter substrate-binding protein [Aureimonas sp. SA4125]|uniref:polysaccharide biosynthesis/export family protein n=1 Tax=Aureimonas sp. SA4125 TaxID=2826993 RepID=UPI001CC77D39|nr:polysaccharide biosynthesis/export family protein [Aureimonas sp. SA4125]BDA82967.1 sugar ABC transporter substrate-binding protein [Aureimonas sp. SA4125]
MLLGIAVMAALPGMLACRPAHAAPADGYRLAPGDVTSFDFLDDALPAEQLTVSSEGEVSIPLIGSFAVAGLTVPEAVDAMRRSFVERRFFVDPQISLAVASFRPIFVLGEVRVPGSFPFQPMLTVEQAVALAGGQSTGAGATEDRVVAQARLHGEIDGMSVDFARAALGVARMSAQLDDRAVITTDDLPANARPFLGDTMVAALMPTEQRILETERGAFETRRDQLTAAVSEVDGALGNLGQLIENQKGAILSAREDRDRVKKLYAGGIKTVTDVRNADRELTAQESHLLEIYNQMSSTRRELGELQRQLVDTTDNRTQTALTGLQKHQTEIEQLIAARRSAEEQSLLLGSLSLQKEQQVATTKFVYAIRRRVGSTTMSQPSMLDDEVAPGDTIVVSIERSAGSGPLTLTSAATGRMR